MKLMLQTFAPFIELVCVVVSLLAVCTFALLVIKAADDFWYTKTQAKQKDSE